MSLHAYHANFQFFHSALMFSALMFVRLFSVNVNKFGRKREKKRRKERKEKKEGEKNATREGGARIRNMEGVGEKIEGIKGNKNKRRTGLQRNDTGSRYYAVFKTRLLKRSPGRNAKSVYPISSVQCFSYTRANESLVIIRAGYRVPRAWFIQRGQTEFPPFVMLRINRWIKRNV